MKTKLDLRWSLEAEKVKKEELIFIAPKGKRMKAFEELRKPQNKHDCQVF